MVISIIGFLATLAVVALNNARVKSRNSKRLANIKQYTTVFELAYDQNSEYPNPGTTGWRCLGDYSDNKCWYDGTSVSEQAALNNILDDWIDLPADENLICGYANNPGRCYEGCIYRCVSRPNGVCESLDIRWFMEGSNQSCGAGTIVGNYNSCTYCKYITSL